MIIFRTLDDLNSPAMMHQTIRRLLREERPCAFLFKVRCKAMGGSRSIQGTTQREGHEITFRTFSSQFDRAPA